LSRAVMQYSVFIVVFVLVVGLGVLQTSLDSRILHKYDKSSYKTCTNILQKNCTTVLWKKHVD